MSIPAGSGRNVHLGVRRITPSRRSILERNLKLGRKDKAPEAVDVAVPPGEMDARTNGDGAASDRNGKRSTAGETPVRRGRHAARTETIDIETQPQMLDVDADESLADLLVARGLASDSQLNEARIHQ